jgi:lysophospholipase L1-like esterase
LISVCSQLLAFDAAPLSGAFAKARKSGAMRVLFSGTSITCGTGASAYSHSFAALIVTALEKDLNAKVHGPNICFGGALSVTQLALIKQEGLKLSPDLIVLEAGTLDAFSPELSLPAIESIFRLAIGKKIPIVAIHPYTSYAAGPKKELMELASLYGIPVIDMSEVAARKGLKLTDLLRKTRKTEPRRGWAYVFLSSLVVRAGPFAHSNDYVHPNDRGHALIRDAVRDVFAAASEAKPDPVYAPRQLLKRQYEPNLDAVRFIPAPVFASKAKLMPLARFKGAGQAAEIDKHGWTKAPPQPNWFFNYALPAGKKQVQHRLRLRVENSAVIDGLLVSE